jgi:DNA-binding XRE family transcriptional regulator
VSEIAIEKEKYKENITTADIVNRKRQAHSIFMSLPLSH